MKPPLATILSDINWLDGGMEGMTCVQAGGLRHNRASRDQSHLGRTTRNPTGNLFPSSVGPSRIPIVGNARP